MIKKIFYFVIILSGFVIAQSSPKIVVKPMEHDFGDVKEGIKVSTNYVIRNAGGTLLKLNRVKASCGCTAVNPAKNELKPGESTELKVEFNTEGRRGKQHKSVNIESNDPLNPTIRLSFVANIVSEDASPQLNFKETTYDFGKVKEGKIVDYIFKFTNQGKAPLEIKDVKTSCGCTAALVSSKKIEPGKEGTLKVELDTSNRSGKMTRNITVSSNDPDQPNKLLTISAEIVKEAN